MTIAAIRFNNPGDVSLPITGCNTATMGGKIVGVPGQPGYAEFPTMATGYNAFQLRLREFIVSGRNTIRRIGALYATDPNWPIEVAKLAGLPIGSVIHADDPEQMTALSAAIIRQETGMTLAELEAASAKYHQS